MYEVCNLNLKQIIVVYINTNSSIWSVLNDLPIDLKWLRLIVYLLKKYSQKLIVAKLDSIYIIHTAEISF